MRQDRRDAPDREVEVSERRFDDVALGPTERHMQVGVAEDALVVDCRSGRDLVLGRFGAVREGLPGFVREHFEVSR